MAAPARTARRPQTSRRAHAAAAWAFNDLAVRAAHRSPSGKDAEDRSDAFACHRRRRTPPSRTVRPWRYARHQRRLERGTADRASAISCGGVIRGVATPSGALPSSIHTAGWIQILGVDTALATATVLHACDGILLDDYLEPFVAPMIAARPLPGTTPQYENMGHIMTGVEGLHTAAAGN